MSNIPAKAQVRLEVFDVIGRLVDVIVNAPLEAGWHNATLDASPFGSGVYVCRISAGSYVSSRKMILMR